jgi:hypothetical protein
MNRKSASEPQRFDIQCNRIPACGKTVANLRGLRRSSELNAADQSSALPPLLEFWQVRPGHPAVSSGGQGAAMTVVALLDRLHGVRQTRPGRWLAKCPAHEDRSPSLSVRELDDGTILVKDFGGCGASDVVAAVGLELKDLFTERPPGHQRKLSRAWLDARDVLACLSAEGQIVAIAASDIAEGRPISGADADRVLTAAGRIRNAWGAFNGHP